MKLLEGKQIDCYLKALKYIASNANFMLLRGALWRLGYGSVVVVSWAMLEVQAAVTTCYGGCTSLYNMR